MMYNSIKVNFRVDPNDWKEFEESCNKAHLSRSKVLRLFIKNVNRDQTLIENWF